MNNEIESLTYYAATKKYDLRFPTLEEDLDVDVVIIGGGFSGINTALELAEKGITNIAILEGRYLGYGGTGRNGGQVMAGIGHDLEKIKRHVGPTGLETIFKISNLGAGIIRERIKKYDIDADFCFGYGYLGSNARQEKTLRGWLKEFRAVAPEEEIELYTGAEVKQVVGSDAYTCALKHMGGGHVHSLNLLLGEAKALSGYGVKIFENSSVLNVEYGPRITVRTAMGSVRANKMLWACNGFLNGMEPQIYRKTINTYAFQLATEPLSDDLIRQISPIRSLQRHSPGDRLLPGDQRKPAAVRQRYPPDRIFPVGSQGLEPQPDAEGVPVPERREDRSGLGRPAVLQRQPVPADRHAAGSRQRVLRAGLLRLRRDAEPHRVQGAGGGHERRIRSLRSDELDPACQHLRQGQAAAGDDHRR